MAEVELQRSSFPDRFSCLPHPQKFSPDGIVASFRKRQAQEMRKRAQTNVYETLQKGELSRKDIVRMNEAMIRVMGGNQEEQSRDLRMEDKGQDLDMGAVIRFGPRADDISDALLSVILGVKPLTGERGGTFHGVERVSLPEGTHKILISTVGRLMPGEAKAYYSFIKGDLQDVSPHHVLLSWSQENDISKNRMIEPEEMRSFFERTLDASMKPPPTVLAAFPKLG